MANETIANSEVQKIKNGIYITLTCCAVALVVGFLMWLSHQPQDATEYGRQAWIEVGLDA